MGHSDEWTFADYFKQEQAVFRGMISAAVALRWMIEHDFELPDDAGLKQMEAEVNRELCEAWGEIFSLAVLRIVRLPLCTATFLHPNTITI